MMKKGKWSKEEDNLIKNHIEKHGIGRSWQALSNTLGLQRCGRSCRSRWLNYLRPGLRHGNFTPAEERIICEMDNEGKLLEQHTQEEVPGGESYRRRNRPGQTASTSSDARTPVRDLLLTRTPSPPVATRDQTGEMTMDIICAPMSPIPLDFMEPELLACVYKLDDIDSFLSWFDRH